MGFFPKPKILPKWQEFLIRIGVKLKLIPAVVGTDGGVYVKVARLPNNHYVVLEMKRFDF